MNTFSSGSGRALLHEGESTLPPPSQPESACRLLSDCLNRRYRISLIIFLPLQFYELCEPQGRGELRHWGRRDAGARNTPATRDVPSHLHSGAELQRVVVRISRESPACLSYRLSAKGADATRASQLDPTADVPPRRRHRGGLVGVPLWRRTRYGLSETMYY